MWGTILTTGLAVLIGLVFSVLAAIFIVEFAPVGLRRILDPVVRLLAGVPSVVYGLIGILVIAPWVEHNFISEPRKSSVEYVVQLTGANLSVAVLILTVMITPIMVAIIVNALTAVPQIVDGGLGGARREPLAHHLARLAAHRPTGDHRRRRCSPRVARWARRSCSRSCPAGAGFAPNLLDGTTALFEPARPLAATIIHYYEDLSNPPDGAHPVRDGGRAARLDRPALARRLGGQAADETLRDPPLTMAGPTASAQRTGRPRRGPAPGLDLDVAAGRSPLLRDLCWAAGATRNRSSLRRIASSAALRSLTSRRMPCKRQSGNWLPETSRGKKIHPCAGTSTRSEPWDPPQRGPPLQQCA